MGCHGMLINTSHRLGMREVKKKKKRKQKKKPFPYYVHTAYHHLFISQTKINYML